MNFRNIKSCVEGLESSTSHSSVLLFPWNLIHWPPVARPMYAQLRICFSPSSQYFVSNLYFFSFFSSFPSFFFFSFPFFSFFLFLLPDRIPFGIQEGSNAGLPKSLRGPSTAEPRPRPQEFRMLALKRQRVAPVLENHFIE